ncbi:transcription antitermination factor NusB [Endozoicomonas sp. OPT23]|uniref:transcription antitermination factor NusB n=1 Tax=Endozoicomonas sp. OPT23 TaxID=2072845 RepID=UPI00129B276D|nr:transcription antitermination factor NusB [Endozoicomonas sp. OPT23]MRI32806.1 transcription antitermination factor NusB [Endozoicomonas sp. OPT23]
MSTDKQDKGQKSAQRPKPSARRRARQLALQALYQWQMSKSSIAQIEMQFRSDNDFSKVDDGYFHMLLTGIARDASKLDDTMSPILDRPLTQLDPVETAALRIGCYELVNRADVPYRVVINEAIELVKRFGAQDSHRYINGILDKLAPRIRTEEVRNFRRK